MTNRYFVQRRAGEWCVMDSGILAIDTMVAIAVGCPIGQGGTEAGREYAERIARQLNMSDELIGVLEMLCNGIEWHIENNPNIMNESDAEALAEARAAIAKAGQR